MSFPSLLINPPQIIRLRLQRILKCSQNFSYLDPPQPPGQSHLAVESISFPSPLLNSPQIIRLHLLRILNCSRLLSLTCLPRVLPPKSQRPLQSTSIVLVSLLSRPAAMRVSSGSLLLRLLLGNRNLRMPSMTNV